MLVVVRKPSRAANVDNRKIKATAVLAADSITLVGCAALGGNNGLIAALKRLLSSTCTRLRSHAYLWLHPRTLQERMNSALPARQSAT